MTRFRLSFSGRKTGAIGVPSQLTVTLSAWDEADAIRRLYERYEHIHGLVVTEIGPE